MAKSRDAASGPSAVERVADWALAIDAAEIPDHALQQAKLLLLDTIGCGLAAVREPSARAVLAATEATGGAGQCSVIGSAAKTTLPNAVLANGTVIRVLDLNDYVIDEYGAIGGHPSDNIPVALAAGELKGCSGRDVLTAIVLGYELYGRCKLAMDRRSPWDGSSLSGIVAPVMGGWLLRLDRSALAHAVALSTARAATSAVVRWGEMSAAKSLANALVAQNGVQAVLLAAQGITGPLEVLDHPRGMAAVFPALDAAALAEPLPADSYVMKANVKTYPCVATAQAAIAAALDLHRKIGGNVGALNRIRIVMADIRTVRNHQQDRGRAEPKSREAADHSFNFLIAAALTDGRFGLGQYEGERWNDPAMQALMAKLEMTTDADLARRAPGSFPCRIEATDKDGRGHTVEVLYPPGSSRGGLEQDAIIAKFETIAADVPPAARSRIIDAVMALERDPSLAGLTAALAASARA